MSLPRQRRRRLTLETLEPRVLLSATGAVSELLPVAADATEAVEGSVGGIAYPTAYDQYLLELTNRARNNPLAEVDLYDDTNPTLTDLNESVPLEHTISPDPKQPLAFNLNLNDGARGHSQWMVDTDSWSHDGPTPGYPPGPSPADPDNNRMADAGYPFVPKWGWGENLGWYGTSPTAPDMTEATAILHEGLFVDVDDDERGHRVNMMNPDMREIGIGVVAGEFVWSDDPDQIVYNAVVCTEDFAYSSYVGASRFLTGVAYDDTAVLDDDFYTPGEGLGGVLVSATRQSDGALFSTTTWSSGGYSLLVEPGTYDVVATSAALGQAVYNDVEISDENVKRDFTPGMATLDVGGPVVDSVTPAVTSPFVRVQGTGFVADGGPFYVAGTNCYYLMEKAADAATRGQVDEVLEDAADMGLNVVRTWAFADGYTDYDGDGTADDPYLQTEPGVYNEAFFVGLDYTLYKANQLGLRLTLALVNHWQAYGGMAQYITWDTMYGNAPFATMDPDKDIYNDFYSDDDTVQWYKDHVSAVLNRVNTFTGIAYKDDPTIFSWELANEPRVGGDWSGDTLQDWIDDMADHVKSIDPTHLLTTGLEGFYDENTGSNYMRNGWTGTDFVRNHSGDTIDYAVLHNWPEHWSDDTYTHDSVAWYQEHIDDAHGILGKPVVMEEFGLSRDDDGASTTERDAEFQSLLDTGEAADAAGWNFWILYDDAFPDNDGFGVYYPADRSTAAIVSGAADALAAKTTPALPVFTPVTSIVVHFDEAMDPATIIAANVELAGSGGDGVFGNGDDVTFAPSSVVLDPDGVTMHVNLSSALPADKYRFTLDGTSSITDAAGNRLDGEFLGSLPSGDGSPGGDFMGTFVVADTPDALGVDMGPVFGGAPNPTGPAARSLGLAGIASSVNPSSTQYAIEVAGEGWLRFVDAGGRTDVQADGATAEWHTAQEWSRKRLRGLEPDTAYTFSAMAGDGIASQTGVVAVGTYTTNKDGDVNRSVGSYPVTGYDFALVRQAAGSTGALGVHLAWAHDNNDDGVIDNADVLELIGLVNQAAGATTGVVEQSGPAAVVDPAATREMPSVDQAWLLLLYQTITETDEDGPSLDQPLSSGERLDAALSWDENSPS